MSDARLEMMGAPMGGDVGTKLVSAAHLAGSGQSSCSPSAFINAVSAIAESATRSPRQIKASRESEFVEDETQGVEEERRRQIHDRQIDREKRRPGGIFAVVVQHFGKRLAAAGKMAREIGQQRGVVNAGRIDKAAFAGIAARDSRDDVMFEPAQGTASSETVDSRGGRYAYRAFP
jgi:hypothetical protein